MRMIHIFNEKHFDIHIYFSILQDNFHSELVNHEMNKHLRQKKRTNQFDINTRGSVFRLQNCIKFKILQQIGQFFFCCNHYCIMIKYPQTAIYRLTLFFWLGYCQKQLLLFFTATKFFYPRNKNMAKPNRFMSIQDAPLTGNVHAKKMCLSSFICIYTYTNIKYIYMSYLR